MGERIIGNTELPTGFTTVGNAGGLVFQNAAQWHAADATGTMIQGIYEGRLDKDVYGKSNFKFTATADGESIRAGEILPYSAGATVIVNETGNLARKLENIEIGTEVLVMYDGQLKIRTGPMKGKLSNQFTVAVKEKREKNTTNEGL